MYLGLYFSSEPHLSHLLVVLLPDGVQLTQVLLHTVRVQHEYMYVVPFHLYKTNVSKLQSRSIIVWCFSELEEVLTSLLK